MSGVRTAALGFGVILLAAPLPVEAQRRGPTVFTTPDDPTTFRRSDDIRLYRDRGPEPRPIERVEPVERTASPTRGRVEVNEIRRDLDEAAVPAVGTPSILEQFRRQRELQQTEARIRQLRTLDPDSVEARQLERELEQRRNENARAP